MDYLLVVQVANGYDKGTRDVLTAHGLVVDVYPNTRKCVTVDPRGVLHCYLCGSLVQIVMMCVCISSFMAQGSKGRSSPRKVYILVNIEIS
jgi:hypothetical protein